jgi:hypothetical protein
MTSLRDTLSGQIERGGGVSISVDPDAALLASKVERWAELITDNRPFFEDAADLIANHERRHFDTEGGSTGPRWAALVEWYADYKSNVRPGMPILQFDGHLHKAVVDRGRGYKQSIGKDKATFGIDPSTTVPTGARLIDYARAHTTGIPGRLPSRPVYRWDPNVRTQGSLGHALSQLRQAHIVKARRAALGAESRSLTGTGDAERYANGIDALKRKPTR